MGKGEGSFRVFGITWSLGEVNNLQNYCWKAYEGAFLILSPFCLPQPTAKPSAARSPLPYEAEGMVFEDWMFLEGLGWNDCGLYTSVCPL